MPSPVHLLHSRTRLLIVAGRVNGRGPYKFILDTGSNTTLIESSLFRELGLKESGHPSAKVIEWMALGKLAVANEISIEGGPSRSNIQVLEVNGIKRPDIDPSIRGVLGENFLSGLDLLIDNRHHEITFDDRNILASSLDGEHLALGLTVNVRGMQLKNRPTVSVLIPALDPKRLLHFLVDTGSEGTYIVARQPGSIGASNQSMALLGDSATCMYWKDRLQLGRTITSRIKITSCLKSPSVASDSDGILPTFIFDRVFIAHADGYLILSPIDVSNVSPAVRGEEHCRGNVASIRSRFVEHSIVIVPVMVNDSGPYDWRVLVQNANIQLLGPPIATSPG
ncbi:MAG TPA: aspartyl protease family protein [Terracidiphilus sp.]|nr:aspartyl protease family protein [Terracidiphilus sp.]